jgi:glycosyltransferase involved in cell wall biosynthesis
MSLISVIIPMRNAEPYVRAAVESVLAQRGEGFDLEVVVIDDGSTDGSAEVVRGIGDSRVRVIPGPQKGISAAFNAGLAQAKGEFLARCDADDLYPAGRLAWQVDFLQQHRDFGAVSGSYSTMTHGGKLVAERKTYGDGAEVTDELRRGVGRSHVCAYLFRTDALRWIGGCRTFFVTAEDVDVQLRLAEITRVWYEPRNAYLYRLHDSSITHSQKAAERSFFEQCAKEFQQQRLSRPDKKDDLELGRPPAPPKVAGSVPVSAKQQIQKLLLGQAWAAHGAGRRGEGLSLGLRAWMTDPCRLSVLRSLVALAVKPVARPLSPLPPGEG